MNSHSQTTRELKARKAQLHHELALPPDNMADITMLQSEIATINKELRFRTKRRWANCVYELRQPKKVLA